MRALYRTWQAALAELTFAIRSRRALVTLCLYLLAGGGCMYGTISILGKMESALVEVLALPASEKTGVVSARIWQSKKFQRIVRDIVADKRVYADIEGSHPAELIYAWFVFLVSPLLVALVSAGRVAEDIGSGAVRYAIVRCTRLEWSFGKFFGQAFLIVAALAAGAVAAWGVAVFRLAGAEWASLLASMMLWGVKAWVYSLAWLGMALGVSHFSRTGGKAVSMALMVSFAFSILPVVLHMNAELFDLPQLEYLDVLVPGSARTLLWRSDPLIFISAVAHLLLLGVFYLLCGHSVFARRDA